MQEFSVGRLAALDAATLATLARFTVGGGGEDSFQVIPGRDNTGAYLLRGQTGTGGSCVAVDLEALDPFGQRRATVRLSDRLGGATPRCLTPCAGAVVLRNPKAPADLVAQVTGGSVSPSWQNPGDTVDLELEVGLAPGATDLRLPVGDTTAFGAAGVAPGAYYVRVRARNEVGASQPSRHLRVGVR